MRVLAETCRLRESEEITAEKIKAYSILLQDITPEVVDRAMLNIARESIWYPTVAEIRLECGKVVTKMQGEIEHLQFKRRLQIENDIKNARFQSREDGQQPTREELQAEFQDMLKNSSLKRMPSSLGDLDESDADKRIEELKRQAKQLGVEKKAIC
jgi:hypothetical protein